MNDCRNDDSTIAQDPVKISAMATNGMVSDLDNLAELERQAESLLRKADPDRKHDEIPGDIRAFFGHPLTAATTAINGDAEDTHASALALLHEYQNLPAIDRSDMKIGDKFESLTDILEKTRANKKKDGGVNGTTLPENGGESGTMTKADIIQGLIRAIDTKKDPWLSQEVEKYLNETKQNSQMARKLKVDSPSEVQQCAKGHTTSFEQATVSRQNSAESQQSQQPTRPSNNSPLEQLVSAIKQEPLSDTDSGKNSPATKIPSINLPPCKLGLENSSPSCAALQNALPKCNGVDGLTADNLFTDFPIDDIEATQEQDRKPSESTKRLMKVLTEKIMQRKLNGNQAQNGQDDSLDGDLLLGGTADQLAQFVPVTRESFLQDLRGDEFSLQNDMHMTDISFNAVQPEGLEYNQNGQTSNWHQISNAQQNGYLLQNPATTYSHVQPPPAHQYTSQSNYYMNTNYSNQNGYSNSNNRLSPPSTLQNNTNQYNGFTQQTQHTLDQSLSLQDFGYRSNISHENLKSPDSGYHETCNSPSDATSPIFSDGHQNFYSAVVNSTNTTVPTKERPMPIKRRHSSVSSTSSQGHAKTSSQGSAKMIYPASTIPKLENNITGYNYFLESPISTSQRIDEDKMTYLNKGQFYTITLDNMTKDRSLKCNSVKSVIMVVFRDDKTIEDEMKAWEFWHSRQHSVKQRILDIDTKNSTGLIGNCVDEVSHNAVSVRWNPADQPAKVSLAVNCLSTDFSNQKGVKGFPLHVQIDTYEDVNDTFPCHRGYCQIKIFCDKGAERKTRDEERRKESKGKCTDTSGVRKRQEDIYHPPCERSEFYHMADLQKRPLLFSPVSDYGEYSHKIHLSPVSLIKMPSEEINSTAETLESPAKKRCLVDRTVEATQKVLLYVREVHEQVYTALLVKTPTLKGLTEAIHDKYSIPVQSIKNIYKRSRKGILVRMDDNIVRHYSHEATFIISIQKASEDSDTAFDVILTELDED